jgi:glyoxylate/hydroxypyruvate reductase A
MQAHLPTHEILSTGRDGLFPGADSDLAEVGYLLAWRLRQETLDRLRGLRAILSLGAGVDHIFALRNLPDVPMARIVDPDLTGRMTDYIVWQVLDHFRRGPTYRRQQVKRIWDELDQPATRDVTVGILGLGNLGRDAAEVLTRMGFRVRGWARSEKSIAGVEHFHGRDGLGPFLAGIDILVALLPLTPETRGLIDANLLRKLRKDGPLGGAVLINAGRGGSHVESDIAEALRDGTLVGATLDVFEREPLPAESPLWELENLTITPHFASASDPEALCAQIADQIRAFERGEPLKNRVDPARGY